MPSKKTSPRPSPKPKGRPLKKKRAKKKKPSPLWLRSLAGLFILALILILAGYLIKQLVPDKTVPVVVESQKQPAKVASSKPLKFEIYPEEPMPKPEVPESAPTADLAPGDLPLVSIIIDDMGYDRKLADKFLSLDAPLTFSILPFSPSQQNIQKAAASGRVEIMLHLPMEPEEYPRVNPGPGALLTAMTADELIRQLTDDIQSVPGAKGVNNHMGSKMTAVSSQMYQIFSILKREGMFFIDSRTTVNTLCRPSARLLQVPFAERDVFLDHVETEAFVRKQLNELVRQAEQQGRAIGIGHPHMVTYEVLREMLPALKKKVRLVPASQLAGQIG